MLLTSVFNFSFEFRFVELIFYLVLNVTFHYKQIYSLFIGGSHYILTQGLMTQQISSKYNSVLH